MKQVIVTVKGGMIEAVYCEDNSVIVDVYDKDCDEHPDDNEIKKMVQVY